MRRWTPEEDQTLIDDYEACVGLREIAQKLDRTSLSIKGRITALGLGGRAAWTSSDKRTLRAMWNAGEKVAVIAVTLGRTDHAVMNRRAMMGLPRRLRGGERA